MNTCTIRMNGVYKDEIFDLNSKGNRDNGFYSWVTLQKEFAKQNFSLHTPDINEQSDVAFELHIDVQGEGGDTPCYLVMFETPFVCPENVSGEKLKRYRKVFTWNDLLVDGDRFIKANFPNPVRVPAVDGFADRHRFCCMISGNRALPTKDPRVLYSERIKVIRWFEQNAAADFDLYGIGWDIPAARAGLYGRVQRRLWMALSKLIEIRPFPSYRGKLDHKKEALEHTRFAICYENVRDLPGYITEKIFDCFFSGCVPVYWGASNITDYIPKGCFIDQRDFDDIESVYRYMKAMPEHEYLGFQERIVAFLQSEAVRPFGSEFFAETIVSTIQKDLAESGSLFAYGSHLEGASS